jgi:hypothetical protein
MSKNKFRGPARFAALLLLAGALAGCGGKSRATVSGAVSYKGKPVTSGEVVFLCQDGKAAVRAAIGPDGSYTAQNVPVGPAKLGVDNPAPAGGAQTAVGKSPARKAPANDPEVQEMKEKASHYVATPPRYTDPKQSGLSYSVTAGTQKHDIALQ